MFGKTKSLASRLKRAEERLRDATTVVSAKGEWDDFNAANEEVLRLERELAASKDEPYAISCDFPVKWDTGAPLPFVLSSERATFLTFYISEPDPNWDGTYVDVVDPASKTAASLCLVKFQCTSYRFGHPNEDVQEGHFLAGRGLDGYTTQIVVNSPWIEEVKKVNSVHPYNNSESWSRMKHYIFWFHDSTFECLAESYEHELHSCTMEQLLVRINERLLQ